MKAIIEEIQANTLCFKDESGNQIGKIEWDFPEDFVEGQRVEILITEVQDDAD